MLLTIINLLFRLSLKPVLLRSLLKGESVFFSYCDSPIRLTIRENKTVFACNQRMTTQIVSNMLNHKLYCRLNLLQQLNYQILLENINLIFMHKYRSWVTTCRMCYHIIIRDRLKVSFKPFVHFTSCIDPPSSKHSAKRSTDFTGYNIVNKPTTNVRGKRRWHYFVVWNLLISYVKYFPCEWRRVFLSRTRDSV